jgi:hypothetical protein
MIHYKFFILLDLIIFYKIKEISLLKISKLELIIIIMYIFVYYLFII